MPLDTSTKFKKKETNNPNMTKCLNPKGFPNTNQPYEPVMFGKQTCPRLLNNKDPAHGVDQLNQKDHPDQAVEANGGSTGNGWNLSLYYKSKTDFLRKTVSSPCPSNHDIGRNDPGKSLVAHRANEAPSRGTTGGDDP